MIRGLSSRQLGLVAIYAAGVVVTVICVLLEAWRAAAVAAVLSAAVMSALVILTLAAMTRTHEATRRRIAELRSEAAGTEMSRSLRRLNKHYALITGSLRSSEERVAAAERRMLSALEAHRQHVEDTLEAISAPRQEEGPSA